MAWITDCLWRKGVHVWGHSLVHKGPKPHLQVACFFAHGSSKIIAQGDEASQVIVH